MTQNTSSLAAIQRLPPCVKRLIFIRKALSLFVVLMRSCEYASLFSLFLQENYQRVIASSLQDGRAAAAEPKKEQRCSALLPGGGLP